MSPSEGGILAINTVPKNRLNSLKNHENLQKIIIKPCFRVLFVLPLRVTMFWILVSHIQRHYKI